MPLLVVAVPGGPVVEGPLLFPADADPGVLLLLFVAVFDLLLLRLLLLLGVVMDVSTATAAAPAGPNDDAASPPFAINSHDRREQRHIPHARTY